MGLMMKFSTLLRDYLNLWQSLDNFGEGQNRRYIIEEMERIESEMDALLETNRGETG